MTPRIEDASSPRVVLLFAYHRLHLFIYRELFGELRRRGCQPLCAVFGEHIANGQIEPSLVASIEADCDVRVLPKTLRERVASRILPRRFPGNTRDARWARRAGKVIKEHSTALECVVVPIDAGGRHIGLHARKYARFVAIQYEPFIQYGKAKAIAGLEADLFCTWGTQDTTALRRAGVTSPIYPAGSPIVRIEPCYSFAALGEKRPLRILYTTTPLLRRRALDFAVRLPFTQDDYRQMKLSAMRDLSYVLERLPGASVAVKLHPMDEGRVEREFVEARDGIAMSVVEHQPTVPIERYIEECDLLVTLGSTTAFQAIAAGKPVVFLNYGSWTGKHEMGYLAYSFALPATDSTSLLWAVRKTLGDQETQEVLEAGRTRYLRHVVTIDGKAAAQRTCAGLLGDVDSVELLQVD